MARYFMNEMTKEWVEKAEADYHTALREYRARKHPNYDAVGFHAQQAMKTLKPLLREILGVIETRGKG